MPKSIPVYQSLVIDNQGLVYHCASKYRTMSCFEDICQEGMIGLIKAAKNFDSNKSNNNFPSYASNFIRGEIKHFFRDKFSLIRMPRGYAEMPMLSLNCSHPTSGIEYINIIADVDAGEDLPGADCHAWVTDFTNQLKPEDRIIFDMTIDRATISAIQSETGLKHNQIGQRRRRISLAIHRYIDRLDD